MGSDAVDIVVGKNADMFAPGYRCGDTLGSAAAIGQTFRMFKIAQTGLGQGCQLTGIVGQTASQHASLQLTQALGPGTRIERLVAWTRQQTRLEPSIQVSTHSSPKGKRSGLHRCAMARAPGTGRSRARANRRQLYEEALSTHPWALLLPSLAKDLLYELSPTPSLPRRHDLPAVDC